MENRPVKKESKKNPKSPVKSSGRVIEEYLLHFIIENKGKSLSVPLFSPLVKLSCLVKEECIDLHLKFFGKKLASAILDPKRLSDTFGGGISGLFRCDINFQLAQEALEYRVKLRYRLFPFPGSWKERELSGVLLELK